MSQPQDRVVLVTGAARGIGQAIAAAFARRGDTVAANDIEGEGLAVSVETLAATGASVMAVAGDVASKAEVDAVVAQVMEAFGRIDILINNAGVEQRASLLDLDEAHWDRTLAVNLKGAFLMSQAVGKVMVANETHGSIVNIASIAGRAFGLKDRSAYVASKMGLIGLTREAAREFAEHGIRVNAVCPGVIVTEMTAVSRSDEALVARWLSEIPQGRLGTPDDLTGLVLFLCSDRAAYITGQAINVDGGKVMS